MEAWIICLVTELWSWKLCFMCFKLFFFLSLYDSLTPKSCQTHVAQSITPIAGIIAESSHTTHRPLSDHRFEITLRLLAASPHVLCILWFALLLALRCSLWMPMCHNAYLQFSLVVSLSLMLFSLPIFSSGFFRSSAPSFPRPPHSSLPSPRFNPYLQFPPSASFSANLHHTTHSQQGGERNGGREGENDGE